MPSLNFLPNHRNPNRFRLLKNIMILTGMLLVAWNPAKLAAQSSSIEDLLNSVDDTLKGRGGSKKEPSDKGSDPAKPRRKPASEQPSAPRTQPQEDPEAAKKSLSTPRVFEIPANVQITRAEVSPRKNRVHLGLVRREMQGGGELEKDEDRFNVKTGQAVYGARVGADRNIWDNTSEAGAANLFGFLGGDVEIYRGGLSIKRTGVYNEEFRSDMTMVDWFVRGEFGWLAYDKVMVTGFYGFGGETINQAGRGVTDSASGGFSTDKLGMTAGYEFSDEFSVSLSLQKNGALIARGPQVPKALSLGLFLTARL